MKYYCFLLITLVVSMTSSSFANEGEMPDQPIGNGAIYNATSRTVHLGLVGGSNTYHHSLAPGEVLLLHNHPNYSVRLNNGRNRITVNVEAFVDKGNPWAIRWYYITQTGRNVLTIRHGLPSEWTTQIASEIKKSLAGFGVTGRLIPVPYNEDDGSSRKNSDEITKNCLIGEICANQTFKFLNKKLPAYFNDVHDFPFTLTEVYADVFADNPVFLFFTYSGLGEGADGMLDFVTQVLDKALPNDCGHYYKLKGIEIKKMNYEAGMALTKIASLRGTNFGLVMPDKDEPREPVRYRAYAMARVVLKKDLFDQNPETTMAKIHTVVSDSMKDTGLVISKPYERKTWWDHAFFELATQPLSLKTKDRPLAAFNKLNPRVSLCWNIRVTKNRRFPDKPIATIHAYTILHLSSGNETITSAKNVDVGMLSVEHFGIKKEAAKGCEDISVWLGQALLDISTKMEAIP